MTIYQLEEIDAKICTRSCFNWTRIKYDKRNEYVAEEISNKKVTMSTTNTPNQIKNVNLTAYSMQEYVLTNNSTINSRTSTIGRDRRKSKK